MTVSVRPQPVRSLPNHQQCSTEIAVHVRWRKTRPWIREHSAGPQTSDDGGMTGGPAAEACARLLLILAPMLLRPWKIVLWQCNAVNNPSVYLGPQSRDPRGVCVGWLDAPARREMRQRGTGSNRTLLPAMFLFPSAGHGTALLRPVNRPPTQTFISHIPMFLHLMSVFGFLNSQFSSSFKASCRLDRCQRPQSLSTFSVCWPPVAPLSPPRLRTTISSQRRIA